MPRTLTALAVIALVVGACGGGGAAATSAPTVAPGEPAATEAAATAEATEAAAATTSGGGGSVSGDALKALAQELTPAGSTETGHLEASGVYQVYLTTTLSLDQLKTFYDQKAASIPIKEYTKVDASGSLYIGGQDPTLAIIAAPDPQNAGQFSLIISVGG